MLAELPEARSDLQQHALEALQARQYSKCKIYPCLALDDSFVKAIGYMSSIPSIVEKKVPTLPTLVAEGCRAIADASYEFALNSETGFVDSVEEKLIAHKSEKLAKLEALNQKIFAKVLEG